MSASPIYLPQDLVSPAVLSVEAEIIAREGLNRVFDAYFASQADCATMRRVEAERIVRARLREAARLPECAYCLHTIEVDEDTFVAAGAVLHIECARMHDEFMNCSQDDLFWAMQEVS